MDAKQTAEKLLVLTKEQDAEIINTLERMGFRDISLDYRVGVYDRHIVKDFPSDRIIYLSIGASFYVDGK